MGSFLSASVLRSQMGSPESPDRAATSAGNIGQRKPTASCPAGEHLYAFHALPQILSFYFTMISSLEICRGGGHSCARFTSDSSDKLFELSWLPPKDDQKIVNYTVFWCLSENNRDRPYQVSLHN